VRTTSTPVQGNDNVYGSGGNDLVRAGRGNDHFWGGRGDDVIRAGSGADHLKAGPGDDTIRARRDDRAVDVIDCGAGLDRAFIHAGDVVVGCETVSIVH
jgi:Ca2+-binding RTX toxin-like protein